MRLESCADPGPHLEADVSRLVLDQLRILSGAAQGLRLIDRVAILVHRLPDIAQHAGLEVGVGAPVVKPLGLFARTC